MTDPISEVIAAQKPSCGACAFGVPITIPGEIIPRIQCRAGPCVAIQIKGANGATGVQCLRPVWMREDWCFMFAPKPPTPS